MNKKWTADLLAYQEDRDRKFKDIWRMRTQTLARAKSSRNTLLAAELTGELGTMELELAEYEAHWVIKDSEYRKAEYENKKNILPPLRNIIKELDKQILRNLQGTYSLLSQRMEAQGELKETSERIASTAKQLGFAAVGREEFVTPWRHPLSGQPSEKIEQAMNYYTSRFLLLPDKVNATYEIYRQRP